MAQDNTASKAQITKSERLSLARDFVNKMRRGYSQANTVLEGNIPAQPQANVYADGEQLLFEVFLYKRFKLDDVILGQSQNNSILLSLRDFIAILDLPIIVEAEGASAAGWYIAESKEFLLDFESKSVRTDNGEFPISEKVLREGDDIFVPIKDLEQWFNFEITKDNSIAQITIKSDQKLPLQLRYERENRKKSDNRVAEPVLPLAKQPKQLIDVPFVDVATRSRYSKRGDSENSDIDHNAFIRSTGDFAYGTLTTQTQLTKNDKIASIRANYKQESLEPELLGPLKAKRFELGDVVQTNLPIDAVSGQELGVRVTNADPLRNTIRPTTAITGTVFPGWDVELYRGNQFLAFQRVDDDGFYSFDDVLLFNNENDFRVVFYGPQGEIREELISIPVDATLLAQGNAVYDVSLTFDGRQTYRKNPSTDEDLGQPRLQALYETPLRGNAVGSLGFRSSAQDGERNNVAYGGISKVFKETLVNANLAIDDEAEMAAELVARRNFGDHNLASTTRYTMDNYDTDDAGNDSLGGFSTRFNANGPIPFWLGQNPRYSTSLDYNLTNAGDSSMSATAGLNTSYKNLSFNNQLVYTTTNTGAEDTLYNNTGVMGAYGRSRVRVNTNSQIKPEHELKSVGANYNYYVNNKLQGELDVNHTIDPSLTEYSAQLNWLAGWARISPSIKYNSENDVFAGLNTNFGLAREPINNKIRSFDRSIASNGGLSVLVFLDQNGDGTMNEGEEALEGVIVRSLQNGGREATDKNGIAFFNRMAKLRLTDVYVDEETLQDPFWIPGFKGASILPREGYVAELQFPILMAGEMDGTLYAKRENNAAVPLRNVKLDLFNAEGKIEQSVNTDSGGFYLFTRVPPGRYLLLVDQEAAKNGNFSRPQPQQIEIGYDGTIIYGNDIFVQSGAQDVPSTIIAGFEDYKARHPHIDFENTDYNIALNLGESNSRLLMSTRWYRLHTRYRSILSGGQLMVLPEHSFADEKTGKHTLRVGFRNGTLDNAYARCRALVARQVPCMVEVLPAKDLKFARK